MTTEHQTPVVIVTGAAQGIGAATAEVFAEQGAKLVLTDLADGAADTAAEIAERHPDSTAIGLRTDITDPDACDRLVAEAVERHGRLDVLAIATATLPPESPLEELPPQEWERVFAVNATGPFLLCRSAIPALHSPGGRIVAVYSATAQAGVAGYAAYSSSKASLGGLIKSLALELAPRRITINGVAPWHVDAGMNSAALQAVAEADGITVEQARRRRDSAIPLGRQASPREIADAMAFLASPQASYITGTVLDINGGTLMR